MQQRQTHCNEETHAWDDARSRSHSLCLAFQRRQSIVIHIPLLQDSEDGLHSKSSPRQLPENARRLLLIFRFLQTLLAKEFARLLFVAYSFVSGFHSLFD